ncbi:MFS transporter [Salana multivorans]
MSRSAPSTGSGAVLSFSSGQPGWRSASPPSPSRSPTGPRDPTDSKLTAGWAYTGLIAAHLFYVFFCGTWGPVMWVMLSEIFPNRLRGAGMAVAVAVNWLANFLVTLTFPMLVDGVGLSATYGLYALLTAASFFFVRSRVPETRGRALEDMTDDATRLETRAP